MSNKMFVFPGVGSHHTGMGKEFYENFQVVRDTFEEAGDVLKLDMKKMIFSPEEAPNLNKLENSQAALLTLETATYRLYMAEVGIKPVYCLGHSLGEYSALCCAGVIRLPDALTMVRKRGEILNQVAASMKGIMAWIINLDNKIVENLCKDYSKEGEEIHISAFDAPTQCSISGLRADIMKVGERLVNRGAIVYPLNLRGPFHSPYMKNAAQQMKTLLQQFEYGEPAFPVIANQNALPYEKNRENVITNLSQQLVCPLRWQNSLEYLVNRGIKTAVEVGPDKVLKLIAKNNTPSISTYSLENLKDLEVIKENLN